MNDAEPQTLTPSRLIAIKRLAQHADWPVLWDLLKANFPLDESVFVLTSAGFDPYNAAKRDGQRDVLLFVRKTLELPTPASTEDATEL